MQVKHRVLAVGTAVAALTATAVVPATAMAANDPPRADVTSAVERQRVDRVATPQLKWKKCGQGLPARAECTTAKLPLDYDAPTGATVDIAVLRMKARKPAQRIGSLFVNPGGPGGSAVIMAMAADNYLSPPLLDRFDVVGADPRGIGASSYLTCFKTAADQKAAMADFAMAFPWTAAEEKKYITSAKKIGKACSTTGKPLSGAMSTAEVARDMDVLRRAVGDQKLTYLGLSYGTVLGQYYANMFPDRVRALVADGVVNPVHWAGTPATAEVNQEKLMRSADGAYRAMREMLVRCGKQGPTHCKFAAGGDPLTKFETLTQRLKAKPVTLGDEKITYADFIGKVLTSLYSQEGYIEVDETTTQLWTASDPAATPAQVTLAKRALATRIRTAKAATGSTEQLVNQTETYYGVACTDGRHPKKAENWPAAGAKADRRTPYFGRIWSWSSVGCAGNAWTIRDEDAYRGPFNRRTAAPVLFVGNYYDPATNYHAAVSANQLLPGSQLISSDSWGHSAYGSSACVTGAVNTYLIAGTLPAQDLTCVGDVQPFAKPLETTTPQTQSATATNAKQTPVFVPTIPSTLLGTR